MKSVSMTPLKKQGLVFAAAIAITGCSAPDVSSPAPQAKQEQASFRAQSPNYGEVRFGNLKQLTFGGENAEAYFNSDGTQLIFQATRDGFQCDQIFRMNVDGSNKRLVSTGLGRTTCSFFVPNQDKITYSSSHATLKTCPPKPDHSKGYAWPLLPSLDIYVAGPEGQEPTPLAPNPGYDAEAVLSPDGSRVLFTSTRGGDIDIWSMQTDGSDLVQLTHEEGYDGGAFYNADGTKIVYRSNHPKSPDALKTYKDLLANDLVRPHEMNLRIMDADGSNQREILSNGAANFAPYWHPDGERIIFASNMDAAEGRNFDLFLINQDGTGLERVTYEDSFDGFPMFNHDATQLVFASNRHGAKSGETNVFVADWLDSAKPVAAHPATEGTQRLDLTRWQKSVGTLAAPNMAGRGLGTPELTEAAQFVSERFKDAGLEAAGDSGFMQVFQATTQSKIVGATVSVDGKTLSADEFRPPAFSSSGKVEGDVVFVGYGISSAAHAYDDYGTTSVDGKIALAFRYEPEQAGSKRFDGDDPIPESDLRFKAINARHRGAKALILINPKPAEGKDDALYQFAGVPNQVGIPVVHMTWSTAKKYFGDELEYYRRKINNTFEPRPHALKVKAAIEVNLERVTAPVSNVVGRLPATQAKGLAPLVIGAHYDHLGLGGEGSRAEGIGQAHLGADDNASGVALLIELAHALHTVQRDRDVYFVGFTAEESGLLGSHWFVSHPPYKGKAVAMVNLDMVGRMQDQEITVFGTGTAREFTGMLRRAQMGREVSLVLNSDGYGASDHMPFYVESMPVLAFFTGLHNDYHRPTDTVDKLNAKGAMRVGELVFSVVSEVVSGRSVTYQKVRTLAGGDHGGSGKRGYGPGFGSIPDFGKKGVVGVAVSGAKPNSPAQAAGLKAGDVVVKFGEFEVTSLKDFAFAMRQHSAGDQIDVVVLRDGNKVTLKATLGEASK